MLSRLRELTVMWARTSRAGWSMAAARSCMPGSVMSGLRRMSSTRPACGGGRPGGGAGWPGSAFGRCRLAGARSPASRLRAGAFALRQAGHLTGHAVK